MTDDDNAASKAAMKVAERRWCRYFVFNFDRRFLLEQATELPEAFGAPRIRVVERTSRDDDKFIEVVEHLPYSRFGEAGLLNLYRTLTPFAQNRMAKALAKCWAADDELGATDEDAERVSDDTVQPWWYDRLIEMVQQTEAAQRRMAN